MIRNSLLVTVVLLVMYQILLPSLSRKFSMSPNGHRDNIRRAEEYCYKRSTASRVVVGSSLAGELDPNELGPSYYNLAFGAGTALTGLEVIHRSGARPELVLIEVNIFDKAEDDTLLNHLFSPLGAVRKNLSLLWDENRPVNFVVGIPEAAVRKVRKLLDRRSTQRVATDPHKRGELSQHDPALFAQVVELARSDLEHPPREEALLEQLQKIEEAVKGLEKQGCHCVFFEMPIEPLLVASPHCTAIRNAAKRHFPPEQYSWIVPDSEFTYHTKDGTHLTRTCAQHFATHLAEQAQRIRSLQHQHTGFVARGGKDI
jgi:hypothetical protein